MFLMSSGAMSESESTPVSVPSSLSILQLYVPSTGLIVSSPTCMVKSGGLSVAVSIVSFLSEQPISNIKQMKVNAKYKGLKRISSRPLFIRSEERRVGKKGG